jgi:methionyl-tRNA formyltransferase
MTPVSNLNVEAYPAYPKIVFMGTPDYAVPSLEKLIKQGHIIQAVVTQPDRPRGRSKKLVPSPVKRVGIRFDLEILQPEKPSDKIFYERIRELSPDLLVVVAFGQILKKDLLEIPRWGALNIHASLLPNYRGAGPIQRAIINEETKTGLSAMRMEEGLDTGPVLLQKEVLIGFDETAGELHDRLALLSGDILLKTIEGMRSGQLIEKPQEDKLATYAPKIDRSISFINWNQPARAISALIRALDPWPGAITPVGGTDIKLFSSKVVDGEGLHLSPGRIAEHSGEGLLVETGKDLILIREFQAPGKKRLAAADFLRGFPINDGTVLG